MENKHNPDSHEHSSHSWSDLPLDLLTLAFKRISFADFQRAKSVCSSWYSASKQSVPKNQNHWQILFPKDNNDNNNSCTLFNPEEKDKLYKTKDLGVEFTKSVCIATYGSWLLMQDPLDNLYIVNLFTHESINLPPVESLWKDYELHVALPQRMRYKGSSVRSPVFWIDEKTKEDYTVLWNFRDWGVVYSKKGDTSWNQIPETSACLDMVYKNHKLYVLNYYSDFRIFDFSEAIPRHFQFLDYAKRYDLGKYGIPRTKGTTPVVTVTGKVLKVEKRWSPRNTTWSFRVFKVYSTESMKKPRRIRSLGDESMLLDQGITVLANDTDGFIRNSIYFNVSLEKNTTNIFIFNLETKKVEPLHNFDFPSVQFSRAQWFLREKGQKLTELNWRCRKKHELICSDIYYLN